MMATKSIRCKAPRVTEGFLFFLLHTNSPQIFDDSPFPLACTEGLLQHDPSSPSSLITHPPNTLIPATRLPVITLPQQSFAASEPLLKLSLYLECISPQQLPPPLLGPHCSVQEGAT